MKWFPIFLSNTFLSTLLKYIHTLSSHTTSSYHITSYHIITPHPTHPRVQGSGDGVLPLAGARSAGSGEGHRGDDTALRRRRHGTPHTDEGHHTLTPARAAPAPATPATARTGTTEWRWSEFGYSFYLFVVCLFVYLFVCLFVCLLVYLFTCCCCFFDSCISFSFSLLFSW